MIHAQTQTQTHGQTVEPSFGRSSGVVVEYDQPIVLRPNASWYSRRTKRVLDLIAGMALLAFAAPLILFLAVLVRLTCGSGSTIFSQDRVGLNGRTFRIHKLRSMKADRRRSPRAESAPTPYIGPERRRTHKSSTDPRHTRFGRFLRSSSLDELPQLLNVVKGDMSLVGPRPELVHVAKRQGYLLHPRHLERPGMTGTFQISNLRSQERISAGLHLDVDYVSNVTLIRDLRILVSTVKVLLSRRP